MTDQEAREIIDGSLIRMRRLWAPTTSGRRTQRGVDLSTVLVVDALDRSGTALSVAAVADVLGVAAATASRLVDRAVDGRFVAKAPSDTDPRRYDLTLTASGHRLSARSRSFRDDYLAAVLTDWSSEDVERFARYLDRFAAAVADRPPVPEGNEP